jgi:uncharacterized membrane protein YuzA (DUF378 family)
MSQGKSCAVCTGAKLLAGLGALNWGLVGLLQLDLVAQLLGPTSGAARAVYAVIGVAGLLTLLSFAKVCPCSRGECCGK